MITQNTKLVWQITLIDSPTSTLRQFKTLALAHRAAQVYQLTHPYITLQSITTTETDYGDIPFLIPDDTP